MNADCREIEMDVQDFEWEPPSEAQMKLVEARRERSDRIAKLMGDYLLKGYKMLGITCTICDTILLKDRQGADYCIACSELDSDADKDDPVTNQAAALAQARELQRGESQREASVADSSTSHLARGLHPAGLHPAITSGPEISSSCMTGFDRGDFRQPGPLHSSVQAAGLVSGSAASMQGAGSVDSQKYVGELVAKLEWAVQELRKSQNVEYSIQLCQLIKSCADAVVSVKSAFES